MLQAHGLQIAAAVDNGADLLAAVTADKPDVAIVDVRLPPTFTDEGIRAALAARRASIFLKLDLQPSDDDNRRVLAVLAFLGTDA
jgi:DNA-binding NarL/FixJ family response regulator